MLRDLKSTKNTAVSFLAMFLLISSMVSCAQRDIVKHESVQMNRIAESSHNMKNAQILTHSVSNPVATSHKEKKDTTSVLEKAINASLDTDYFLGPEDLIEISVYQVDELKRTVAISSSGYIKLPLAGMIKASGLTVAELETEISRRLEQYLQEPVISVFIKEYRSQRISVLGAVTSPGTHIVTGQKYLLDLLSLSAGLAENAGDICYIQRGKETIVINLSNLLIDGDTRLNVPVFTGDIIHVVKGGTIFVDGGVNRPGSFTMQGKVTLTQAIAMAGGLTFESSQKKIRVYRDTDDDEKESIDINYDKILSKQAEDIFLQDKDIVIVPISGSKRFFQGFVRVISGVFSFGYGKAL